MVTSDRPLLAELSEQGKAMLLARPGDSSDLADKIGRLLDDEGLATQLVAEQRAAVARRFEPARLVAAYAAVYDQALGRVPTPPPSDPARGAGVLR
jgi:glycosyltransferase involved in cell wall biosynthesis